MTPEADETVRIHTGRTGRLTDMLRVLLEHRVRLAPRLDMKDKPLSSPAGATLEDLAAFIRDDRMDARVAAFLPGLALCEIPRETDTTAGEGMLPAAFGLLKLTLTPDRILRSLGWLGEQEHLPLATGMVAQLSAGNHGNRAVQTAWRRLRASGLTPAFAPDALPGLRGFEPSRVAAALLIPLRYGATGALARSVLTTSETKPQAA
jgi:CRISPR-associated protein Csx17